MNFSDAADVANAQSACGLSLKMRRLKAVSGRVSSAMLLTVLASCGGGGSPAVVLPQQTAVLSVMSPAVSQSAAAPTLLAFRASLISATTYPMLLNFATSGPTVGLSCGNGIDYVIPNATGLTFTINSSTTGSGVLTLASATASRQVNVMACPGAGAADKLLSFYWSNGSATNTATGTIRASSNTSIAGSIHLNDTGITTCSSGSANGQACPASGFSGQDAEFGRDATAAITGQGAAWTSAFVFTTLSGGACIADNVTGLTWEAKTTSGLHSASSTFSWYSSATQNGGASGTAAAGTCSGGAAGCDTEKFTAQVNAEALCGFSDWRLPNAQELAGIVDSGTSRAPTINALFANQTATSYWSASPQAGNPDGAWAVDFSTGAVGALSKSSVHSVQLVRGQ